MITHFVYKSFVVGIQKVWGIRGPQTYHVVWGEPRVRVCAAGDRAD